MSLQSHAKKSFQIIFEERFDTSCSKISALQFGIQDPLERQSIPNKKMTTNMRNSRACISETLMVDEKTRTELNLKLIINLKLNENGNKNEQTILDTASEINLISLKLVK